MVLHAQSRAYLAESAGGGPLPGEPGYDLEADRKAMSASAPGPLGVGDEVDHVLDVDADGVPCRLYVPADHARVVVHVHGGGWVTGDLDTHDAVCRLLAARSGLAVLAVDYRLAPEHPFPAPVTDTETAVEWLRREAGQLGVSAEAPILLGDSAGATIAASVALRARDRAREGADGTSASPYGAQVLVYPALDARCDSRSQHEEREGLSREMVLWFWSAYAPDPRTRLSAEVSPGLAQDLSGLPFTVVLTAEHDPLRDEGEEYAARLSEAGVPVVAQRWLGVVHGFWRRPGIFDASLAAIDSVAATLRSRGP